jgi:hypothetical protein
LNKPNSTISLSDFQPSDKQLCDAVLNIMQAGLLLRRESARNLCGPDARLLRSVSDELRQLTKPLLRIAQEMKAAEEDPEHIGAIARRVLGQMAAERACGEGL